MSALTESINKSVTTSILSLVKKYIGEFSKELVKEISENKNKKWNEEEITKIWNAVASEFVIEKSKKKGDVKKCAHICEKGKNPGSQCKNGVSEKSVSGEYCSKHCNDEEKKEENAKKRSKYCSFILTRGRKGEECGASTSSKSKSGCFCSKHLI